MSTDASEWLIEPLRTAHHDRTPFTSGSQALDSFLKEYAGQSEKRGITRTYVAVRKGSAKVVGFCTIRFGSADCSTFPPEDVRHLPKYPIPVLHLARLGVDRSYRGRGLGGDLLMAVLAKASHASKEAGLYAVEVIAKDKEARSFYLKYGFKEFLDDKQHLYLPLDTFRHLF